MWFQSQLHSVWEGDVHACGCQDGTSSLFVPLAAVGAKLEFIQGLRDRLEDAFDVAGEHLLSSASRQKSYYDARTTKSPYEPGDLVWTMNVP